MGPDKTKKSARDQKSRKNLRRPEKGIQANFEPRKERAPHCMLSYQSVHPGENSKAGKEWNEPSWIVHAQGLVNLLRDRGEKRTAGGQDEVEKYKVRMN